MYKHNQRHEARVQRTNVLADLNTSRYIKRICVFIFVIVLLIPSFSSASPGISSYSSFSSVLSSGYDEPAILPLDFVPEDSLLHPDQPVIYFTSIADKQVYEFNYMTSEIKSNKLDYTPERMAFYNDELYVTMTKGHVEYDSEVQNGFIAIIDAQTFGVKETLPVGNDPADVVIDHDGYIYVIPASGSSAKVLSYDRETKAEISSFKLPYASNFADISPAQNTIIAVNQYGWPKTFYYINAAEGHFLDTNQYEGNYAMSNHFRISPDGKYVFTSTGNVLTDRLEPVTKIGNDFSDTAFDLDNNRFFTGQNTKVVTAYSYPAGSVDGQDGFQQSGSFQTLGSISRLFYQNGKLISLSKLAEYQYFIEIYHMPSKGLPDTDPSASPDNYAAPPAFKMISPDSKSYPFQILPMDSLLDPVRPVVYMTTEYTKSVYAFNYEKNTLSELKFTDKPERLAFFNNELYVTLTRGHSPYFWSSSGTIGIIDAQSFKLKDQILVNTDPHDVIVDKEGYIYVLPGSGQWEKVYSYSRTTKKQLAEVGFFRQSLLAQADPLENGFYMVDTDVSPRDLAKTSVSKGNVLKTFNSPYHGEYALQENIWVSPDGKYVFNGSGNVFDRMLRHITSVEPFRDIVFDIQNDRFFTGDESGNIIVYQYDNRNLGRNFYPIGYFDMDKVISNLYYRDNKLMVTDGNTFKIFEIKPFVLPLRDYDIPEEGFDLIDPDAPFDLYGSFPMSASLDLPVNTPILAIFNHNILEGENFNNIALKDQDGQNVGFSTDITENILFIDPLEDLLYSRSYTLTIPAKAITDFAKVNYDLEIISEFQTGREFSRLGGNDRFETSAKISQEGWDQADVVVLATSENFPDALAAAPLARKYNAPILLTNASNLSMVTEAEIDRLNPTHIAIIGGYGAVSQEIETKLESKGLHCVRIAGKDRYETSLEIASYLDPVGSVFIATGSNFPDALSIASFAAANEIPILLSRREGLDENTLDYMAFAGVEQSFIIGGTGVLSRNIEQQVSDPTRIAGIDRYETNYKVLSEFNFDFTYTFFATGKNFPDALTGSALAGQVAAPVVLFSEEEALKTPRWNNLRSYMKMKYILGAEGVIRSNTIKGLFR